MLEAALMQENPETTHAASQQNANRDIVFQGARMQEDLEIKHAAPELKADRELMLVLTEQREPGASSPLGARAPVLPGVLKHAAPGHKVERILLEAVRMQEDFKTKNARESHVSHIEVVLEAASMQEYFEIKHAAPEHKEGCSPDYFGKGTGERGHWPALPCVGEPEAVKQNEDCEIEHAAPEHKANRKIVLEAARMQESFEIKHAVPEHKANREIVLEAARVQEVRLSIRRQNTRQIVRSGSRSPGCQQSLVSSCSRKP